MLRPQPDAWGERLTWKSAHVQLTVYSSLLALGIYALYDQPWLTDSSAFWVGWPDQSIP